MSIQEIEKELSEINNDLFYIDMIDRWSQEDSDRHSKLFRRKIELEDMLNERRIET